MVKILYNVGNSIKNERERPTALSPKKDGGRPSAMRIEFVCFAAKVIPLFQFTKEIREYLI